MLNKGQGDLIESFKASNCHSFLFPTLQSKLTIWEIPFYIPMGSALFSLRPHGFNVFFASDALLNISVFPLSFLQRFALWKVPSNSVSDLCVPSSLSMIGSYLTLDRNQGSGLCCSQVSPQPWEECPAWKSCSLNYIGFTEIAQHCRAKRGWSYMPTHLSMC